MAANRDTPDLTLAVAKSTRAPFGYIWEIRLLGFGRVVERSTRSFTTGEQARQAGEAALQVCRRATGIDSRQPLGLGATHR